MLLGPVEDFGEFIPVSHFFKSKGLDRAAGNDQGIEATILNLVERLIKGLDRKSVV